MADAAQMLVSTKHGFRLTLALLGRGEDGLYRFVMRVVADFIILGIDG